MNDSQLMCYLYEYISPTETTTEGAVCLNRCVVIFFCKFNIWDVNFAQATAIIFDQRTDTLVKVLKFFLESLFYSGMFGYKKQRISVWCALADA